MATATEKKSTVAAKLVKCMESIGQLSKDRRVEAAGNGPKYAYLSEEKVTGALQDALVKHGLSVRPIRMEQINTVPEMRTVTDRNTGNITETPINRIRLLVTYEWRDAESDDALIVQAIGEGMDTGDKATNKAMTAAYKYMVRHTLAISTGDDSDADNGHGTQQPVAQPYGYGAGQPASTPSPAAPAQAQAQAAPSVPQAWRCPPSIEQSAANTAVKKGFSGVAEACALLLGKDWDTVSADKALFDEFATALKAYKPAEVAA